MEISDAVLTTWQKISHLILYRLSKLRPFLAFPVQLDLVSFCILFFIKCKMYFLHENRFFYNFITIAILVTWALEVPTSVSSLEYFILMFCIAVLYIILVNYKQLGFWAVVISVGIFPSIHFALDFCLMLFLLKYSMKMFQKSHCRLWLFVAFITSSYFYFGQVTNTYHYCVTLLLIFFAFKLLRPPFMSWNGEMILLLSVFILITSKFLHETTENPIYHIRF